MVTSSTLAQEVVKAPVSEKKHYRMIITGDFPPLEVEGLIAFSGTFANICALPHPSTTPVLQYLNS